MVNLAQLATQKQAELAEAAARREAEDAARDGSLTYKNITWLGDETVFTLVHPDDLDVQSLDDVIAPAKDFYPEGRFEARFSNAYFALAIVARVKGTEYSAPEWETSVKAMKLKVSVYRPLINALTDQDEPLTFTRIDATGNVTEWGSWVKVSKVVADRTSYETKVLANTPSGYTPLDVYTYDNRITPRLAAREATTLAYSKAVSAEFELEKSQAKLDELLGIASPQDDTPPTTPTPEVDF